MPFKTEEIGYCDTCNQIICGQIKGISCTDLLFINDKSSYAKNISKKIVMCRPCFARVLNMVDKDSDDYKKLEKSSYDYGASLFERGGPGDR